MKQTWQQEMMKTNPKLAINGFFLLNKSRGMSSNTALQKVKRLFRAAKAGHTGSLDPLATGMLPICFGEATKYSQYLLDADKCYEATGRLGVKTSTADAEGEVIQTISDFVIDEAKLKTVLDSFRGETYQVPSMYSALKHEGKPLYLLARAGLEVQRAPRPITIKSLDLTEFDGTDFSIKVLCSKGTYIRNLVEDIGEQLNVGAHVTRLHRVYTAGCGDLSMYTLEDLEQMSQDERMNCLLPLSFAVSHFPVLLISQELAESLHFGRVVQGDYLESGLVQLILEDGQFFGLGQIEGQALKAHRVLASFTKGS